ncbi:aspartyl-trna synthetase [Microvirga tunisiensis]|uniref:Aspartyl-trna synthetase n=1 Tax=Pannonibacter tanglangensis TaxID=2750084 RepID=A0A7X5JAM0_9HYPH|nr:SH3 domain-containing protein [Pannonibacter sp. XCT-53]NBN80172.1 aspartyl-trna synthetase [Pannonibacter sp. XCT-53]
MTRHTKPQPEHPSAPRRGRTLSCISSAFLAFTLVAVTTPAADAQTRTGASGQSIPRFVSLKSDRSNVRLGPSDGHEVAWTYVKSGLPIEITQEFENWRRVRDWEGKEGWLFHSLLSGRRTVLVTPWEQGTTTTTPLYAQPDVDSGVVAYLAPKVLANVKSCAKGWCRIEGRDYDGWIDQTRLFGVYPDEVIE